MFALQQFKLKIVFYSRSFLLLIEAVCHIFFWNAFEISMISQLSKNIQQVITQNIFYFVEICWLLQVADGTKKKLFFFLVSIAELLNEFNIKQTKSEENAMQLQTRNRHSQRRTKNLVFITLYLCIICCTEAETRVIADCLLLITIITVNTLDTRFRFIV